MSYQAELDQWHTERIWVLTVDIKHLQWAVEAHTKVAEDDSQMEAERNYARLSAARSQKALDQKRELLQQFKEAAECPTNR